MRIIVAHNTYRIRGGEDQVFEDEVAMLTGAGHEVTTFLRHNRDFSGLETIRIAAGTVWNRSAASELEDLVRESSADVVHVHNWLPQLSPSVFAAARRGGAAVVQTLHNYRYTCAAGVLYRDGSVCEECVGRSVGWPALRHACYRDSRAATAPVVATLAVHGALGTLDRSVDAFIVLSEFARSKMVEAGLPEDRLHLKPNFVDPDPGERAGDGGYMLYLGRLVEDKGIATLIEAWRSMPEAPPLFIAGAGEEAARAAKAAATTENIEFLGLVDHGDVADVIGGAAATMLPSVNYEGFPKAIVESFAVGTPVVASDIGSLTGLIDVGRTGFLVPPGQPAAIVDTVRRLATPRRLTTMRSAARSEYVEKYTMDLNHARLMEIYHAAIERRRSGAKPKT